MPNLETAQASASVKLILIGDSGTGKTGALASLVKAGYRLRVLDYDNKLAGGILPILLRKECPDKLKNVEFVALRDELKSSALGPIVDGMPTAFSKGLQLMDKWTDGTSPKTWNDGMTIFVVDSLTFMSDAAFNWAKGMNPSAKDPRQWFYSAQNAVEDTLALLTASSFTPHVIVISHVSWQDRPDGTMKGYPSSVGKALGPTIPAYFENMALCQTLAGKRTLQTTPTALVDLKNPAAFKMLPTLSIETGLADFFKTIRS
ncbi:MAG TPA: AAA family ATPase [Candidatus Bathyarchaeia archaeon]|nr:AAA family ATPase [Candidatus Bathyarchaeia archaeon]